jgi:outer membrane protein assembly factor BamB
MELNMNRVLVLLFFLSFAIMSFAEDNWPDFRGPHGDGISNATGLPLEWSETKNIKWKTAIHDCGFSTPVVWGEQIWLTTAAADGHKFYGLCIDKNTGKIVHDILLFEETNPQAKNDLNSYATPSPVIEQGRVYLHFGTFGTVCLDTQTGFKIWERRDLHCDHLQGPASSPFLFENLLILHLEGQDVQMIVALDKKTGKTIWRTDRPAELYQTIPLYKKAYITPILIQVNGQPQLISNGAQACIAYDPRTGKEIWRVYYGGDSTISRPVAADGLVFVNTGLIKPQELWAVRPDGTGDVSSSHVVWKVVDNVPGESSPVVVNGRVYMVNEHGVLTCLDDKTGAVVWTQKLAGQYGASPVYADGRIYFFSKKGLTTVIQQGSEYKLLAQNQLDDGFMASPAITGTSLILRTITHLYRIE